VTARITWDSAILAMIRGDGNEPAARQRVHGAVFLCDATAGP
jgi:hypothetical protein